MSLLLLRDGSITLQRWFGSRIEGHDLELPMNTLQVIPPGCFLALYRLPAVHARQVTALQYAWVCEDEHIQFIRFSQVGCCKHT